MTGKLSTVIAGVGTVHDGLWAGLHQADPDSPAGCLVVDRILDCLQRAAGGGKAVYLCGHSLGGGLVSMLSLILPTRWATIKDTDIVLATPTELPCSMELESECAGCQGSRPG